MKIVLRRDRATRWILAGSLCIALGLSPARAEESVSSKLLTMVSKMSVEQQQALYDFLNKFSAPAAPAAPEPQAALTDSINKLKESAVKGDVDGMLSVVADDFQQSQLGGKDGLKAALATISAGGQLAEYAKSTTISADKATFKRTGDSVLIDPITVEGPFGSASLSLTAKLINNEWKVTGAELH